MLYSLQALSKYYEVSVDYLIGVTENTEETLTPIEELHLTDEAIQVLKDGKINTRLLSEIITHPAFRRAMIDTEVYVNRLAESNVQNVNALYEAARQQILKNSNSNPEEVILRTLEAGQIDEDEYFSHVITKDIMTMLKTIRENHKTDPTTADETASEKIMKAIEEIQSVQGTTDERKYKWMCSMLGIRYDLFPQQEMEIFMKVINASPIFKKNLINYSSQRGKNSHSKHKGKRR